MYGFHARLDNTTFDTAVLKVIDALKLEGFIDPQTMIDLIDKPVVREVADDAKARLLRVRGNLQQSSCSPPPGATKL